MINGFPKSRRPTNSCLLQFNKHYSFSVCLYVVLIVKHFDLQFYFNFPDVSELLYSNVVCVYDVQGPPLPGLHVTVEVRVRIEVKDGIWVG